jgi:putative phosphoesterase
MPPVVIGLVSDTHGLVRPALYDALAGVRMILHAGDVGGGEVLRALASIAPVRAVRGNVDPPGPPVAENLELELEGVSIHVSHGHELGSPTPATLLAHYEASVIVYGHTHKALVHHAGARLVVNPGAAGPRRFNLTPSVAKLTIEAGTATAEVVTLPL